MAVGAKYAEANVYAVHKWAAGWAREHPEQFGWDEAPLTSEAREAAKIAAWSSAWLEGDRKKGAKEKWRDVHAAYERLR